MYIKADYGSSKALGFIFYNNLEIYYKKGEQGLNKFSASPVVDPIV